MNGNAQLLVSILLPEGNAASTLTGSLVVPGSRSYRVIGANFTPNAAAAANDTNNATITVSAGSVTVGALTTDVASGSLVAGTDVAFTPPSNAEVVGGETRLQVAKTVAGSGVVVSGSAVLLLEEIR
jgi:hypothetical protein